MNIHAVRNSDGRFLDPCGFPIDNQNLAFDSTYRPFDIAQLTDDHGILFYRGQALPADMGAMVSYPAGSAFASLPQIAQLLQHQRRFMLYRSREGSPEEEDQGAQRPAILCEPVGDTPLDWAITGAGPQHNDSADNVDQFSTDIDRVQIRSGTPELEHPSLAVYPAGSVEKTTADDPTDFYNRVSEHFQQEALKSHNYPQKRKWAGFSSENLVANAAIDCFPCRPSTLSHALQLKIFRHSNFTHVSTDVYQALLPALTLAERFLIDPVQLPFWATVAFGERYIDEALTRKLNSRIERIRPIRTLGQEMQAELWNRFEKLGEKVEFRFQRPWDNSDLLCFGCHANVPRSFLFKPAKGAHPLQGFWPAYQKLTLGGWVPDDVWEQPTVIRLHQDFYSVVKGFMRTRQVNESARLRWNFFFAVNIVHELAHAWEYKCGFDKFNAWMNTIEARRRLTESQIFAERPEFDREVEAAIDTNDKLEYFEMGAEFERYSFGGRVHPINARIDCLYGMVVYRGSGQGGPPADFQETYDAGSVWGHSVPMGYMEEIQQASWWTRPNRTLRIPKFGAATYIYNCTSTQTWRDCRYDQEQEAMNRHGKAGATDAQGQQSKGHDDVLDGQSPNKKQRADLTPAKLSSKRQRRGFRDGRLSQTSIKSHFLASKNDKKTIYEEMLAMAAKEAKDAQESDIRKAAEKHRLEKEKEYREPARGQTGLHDFYQFEAERDSSPESVSGDDPAVKKPENLTVKDKWLLFEELYCLKYKAEPREFLARRTLGFSSQVLPKYDPHDDSSWQQAQIDELLRQRALDPARSYPVQKRLKEKIEKANLGRLKRLSEIEELLMYFGYSRIDFMWAWSKGTPLPMGIRGRIGEQYGDPSFSCSALWKSLEQVNHGGRP